MELKLLNRLCINNKFQEMYHCRVTSALQLLVCDIFRNFADGSFIKLGIFCVINHYIILKLINALTSGHLFKLFFPSWVLKKNLNV